MSIPAAVEWVQHESNKVAGLGDIKPIVRRANQLRAGSASFSRHYVYERPDDFLPEHIEGAERLLFRADEKGREYRRLLWNAMPRPEVVGPPSRPVGTRAARRTLKEAFTGGFFTKEGARWPPGKVPPVRVVMHPTFRREAMLGEGLVSLDHHRGKNLVTLLHKSPDDAQSAHQLFEYNNGQFTPLGELLQTGVALETQPHDFSSIFENLKLFVHAGVQIGKLKFHPNVDSIPPETVANLKLKGNVPQSHTYVKYVVWKHAPDLPEYYDLHQFWLERRSTKKKTRL